MFLLVPVLGAAVHAQTKDSPSDEAVKSTGKAERRLDNISFRMTLKTEWFSERDGDLFNESLETYETSVPDRYHSISENGSNRVETIIIGEKTYRRINDNDWESVAVPPLRKAGDASSVALFGELAGGARLPIGEGKFVAKGTIDGHEVTMYEVRTVRRDSTPEGGARTETKTYYIDNAGLIVRRVIEHEFAGDKRFMRSTANYSYGDIRIEEPITPVATRKR